jgi:HEAT repeat protein
MSKKNTPEKTRQRTLAFVAVFVGFLGTSIFAGINVFAAHQKNQDFSQLDAEEKFSRLPEYLLVDRSLLKDKDSNVRSSAAKALGNLQSKEAITELILLHKIETKKGNKIENKYVCSATKALAKLRALSHLMSSIEQDNFEGVVGCVAVSLYELRAKETIPQLIKMLKDSDYPVQRSIGEVLGELQLTKKSLDSINSFEYLYGNEIERKLYLMDFDTSVALSTLKLKKIAFPLLGFLHDSDIFLPPNDTKKIIPQLIELLEHPDVRMRRSAAHALGKLQAKEAIDKLRIMMNESHGGEQYKILETLIILDGLNESQIKKWMVEIIKEIEGNEVFSDWQKKSLAIDVSTQIYLRFSQRPKAKVPSVNQSLQIRDNQWILTGSTLAISLFLLLSTLFFLRQLHRISWQGHLICYFPEEVVGELVALRRELTQSKKSTILIQTTLLYVVFTLVWSFYIQINIDNLWLPSKDQRRR